MRMRASIPVAVLLLSLAATAGAQNAPGTCTLGTGFADLQTPDLAARLFNTGALFYGGGSGAQYVVPRTRGLSPVFAADLWFSGETAGETRVAGSTFGAATLPFPSGPAR